MSDPIRRIKTPIRLEYTIAAGTDRSRFLRHVSVGRLFASRCPTCRKAYMPARGTCPMCGVRMDDEFETLQTGTVSTFCVVNIPFEGQMLTPPYACAHILIDGTDTPLFHLVGGVDAQEVRMGMRVRAVWKDEADREPSLESIRYFEPTGEPDADFDSYREHL